MSDYDKASCLVATSDKDVMPETLHGTKKMQPYSAILDFKVRSFTQNSGKCG